MLNVQDATRLPQFSATPRRWCYVWDAPQCCASPQGEKPDSQRAVPSVRSPIRLTTLFILAVWEREAEIGGWHGDRRQHLDFVILSRFIYFFSWTTCIIVSLIYDPGSGHQSSQKILHPGSKCYNYSTEELVVILLLFLWVPIVTLYCINKTNRWIINKVWVSQTPYIVFELIGLLSMSHILLGRLIISQVEKGKKYFINKRNIVFLVTLDRVRTS